MIPSIPRNIVSALLLAAGLLAAACEPTTGTTATNDPPAPSAVGVPLAETAAPMKAEPRSPRFGSAQPRPKPAGALRLVSYNVENLFDDHDDPALSGRYEDINSTKPAEHLKALADTIRLLDPDVLALQEVESEQALLWFRDRYLADMGYDHVASPDAGDERGIEQAVLSRYPIVETKNWVGLPLGGVHPEKWGDDVNWNAGKPITFHRSPLLATVEVPGREASDPPYRLTLLVVHKKSGRHAGYWREKEAAKTAEIIADLRRENPERNIAVLGDFNAEPDEQPVVRYLSDGLIDAFASRKKGDPAWVTHESGRTIDHILVTPGLARDLAPEPPFILGTPARPEGSDWRRTPPPVGYASDHYPLVVDLIPRDR